MDYNDKRSLADMVLLNYAATSAFDDTAAMAGFSKYFGPPGVYEHIRNIPNVPNMAVLASSQALVVLVGGVRDNAMRTMALAGWTNQPAIGSSRGFNAYGWQLAEERLFPLIRPYLGGSRPVILVGHSMGSMVHHSLNHLFNERGFPYAELVLTTGAPRPLSNGYSGEFGTSVYWRFMTFADPICFFPPRFEEAPYVMAASVGVSFPIAVTAFWAYHLPPSAVDPSVLWPTFGHGPGGIALDDIGMSVPAMLPLFNPLRGAAGQASEVMATAAASGSEHDISNYVVLVRQWANLNGNPDKQIAEGAHDVGGSEWGADPSFILPVTPDGFYVLPLQGGEIVGAPNPIQTGTMPSASGPPEGCLYLRGELVACFPNRSRARTAARKLNQFLSRLPTATSVSVSGLTAGMGSYLAEAAIGGGVDKKPVKVVS